MLRSRDNPLRITNFFIKHLYLVLLIPPVVVVYPLLSVPGIPIGNGDFPYLETSLYGFKKLWTWNDFGSYHNMEYLPRYPIIGLTLIAQFFNLSPDISSKLLIIAGFLVASFSFYFSCLLFFKSKVDTQSLKFKIAAILGSLFYSYNVWSFHRIGHWYFWIGYALLPLFFVSVIYTLKNPKNLRYLLVCVVLWSAASSTPHMVLFYGLIFAALSTIFMIRYIRKNRSAALRLLIPIFLIISVYLLVNSYWIYPYVLSSKSETFLWRTVLSEEATRDLSSDSPISNVLRLLESTYNMGTINVVPATESLLYPVWIFSSFIIPIFVFSTILWKKRFFKYILFFSVVSLIGLFLTIGNNAPFDFYNKLLLFVQFFSSLQLLFREPDKWGFLVAIGYSFLILIASFNVLEKLANKNYNKVYPVFFVIFILASITIYFYPSYKDSMENLYHPVVIPPEFSKLDNLKSSAIDRAFIMPVLTPYEVYDTTWGKDKRTESMNTLASPVPNIGPSDYNNVEKYHRYIVNLINTNKVSNIDNIIHSLGASYLIYHNDTLIPYNNELLKKLSSLDGVRNVENLGLIKIFKIGNEKGIGQANIPISSMLVVGGLDRLGSLNSLISSNLAKSSLVFLDQYVKDANYYPALNNTNYVFLDQKGDDFIFSFVDDKYIISPFDATDHYDPEELWSKTATNDPGNAYFNPELASLGIENWDFDYGKGLVMTKALGTNLSMPVEIKNHEENNANASKSDTFSLFIRYMKNQKGGAVKVYLDNKLVNEVNTFDKLSNKFVWEKIGSLNLTNGKHNLTLQNAAGFNAVNIFALIPPKEMNRLNKITASLLDKTPAIYLMEAESNYYGDNKTVTTGSSNNLFGNQSVVDVVNNGNANKINSNGTKNNGNSTSISNSTFTKTFRGQFKVPQNTDFVSLQFFAKQNPNTASSYSIKNLEIIPAYKNYTVFASDFEDENANENKSVSVAKSIKSDWINYQKGILSTQETSPAIDGNKSLKIDVKQGKFSYWGILSTDFIPVSTGANYNETFDISTKDVKQLHSKVFYYDSAKNEIKWDFAFPGRDGSFEQRYNKSLSLPAGTKYVKLQMWVSPNPKMNSSYLLDNVKLEEIIPRSPTLIDNFSSFENVTPKGQIFMILNNSKSVIGNNHDKGRSSLNVELQKGNSTHSYAIQTKPFPVEENRNYDYTITVDAKNVSSLGAIASFKKSRDVIENNRYGDVASNGGILSLSPGSEASTKLDILKPSNYVIALRAKTCETCTFLRVTVEKDNESNISSNGKNENVDNRNNTIIKTSDISLKNNTSGAKWLWLYPNSTYPLKNGTYQLKIYSDGQADLDSVVLYSVGDANFSTFKNSKNLVFNPKVSSPAQIADYKKINPTKHILKIQNATRPFMISFAEAYDPLWAAYSDDNNNTNSNFKTSSIPLYSVVNGFYINKTGNYNLTIEYQPQKWFIQGGTVSIVTVIIILIILIVGQERIEVHLKKLNNLIRLNQRSKVNH